MKVTTSFNLEENTLNDIMEYKAKYKLSSRNMALELMLNERKTMARILEHLSLNANASAPASSKSVDSDIKKNDAVKNSIMSSYDSMPD